MFFEHEKVDRLEAGAGLTRLCQLSGTQSVRLFPVRSLFRLLGAVWAAPSFELSDQNEDGQHGLLQVSGPLCSEFLEGISQISPHDSSVSAGIILSSQGYGTLEHCGLVCRHTRASLAPSATVSSLSSRSRHSGDAHKMKLLKQEIGGTQEGHILGTRAFHRALREQQQDYSKLHASSCANLVSWLFFSRATNPWNPTGYHHVFVLNELSQFLCFFANAW